MSKRVIPSLDGLRGISILLVIWSHALNAPVGELGVQVFFVISGYLITTLLLQEYEASGGVDLSAFYMRRATRIMPAYVAYLLVIAGLIHLGFLSLPNGARWWPALTYT